jgi:hypothetical protein
MTGDAYHTAQHPAPHAHRVEPGERFFGLFGGPIAWFVQLCGGYALASQPCFVDGVRVAQPLERAHWSMQAMVALMLIAAAVAIASFIVSWGAFVRTDPLMETGGGRTRFLALWGMVLSGGFTVTTAITALAFITLPRCAG